MLTTVLAQPLKKIERPTLSGGLSAIHKIKLVWFGFYI
jgi:hypothetical protein